jgi:hypothetical protein
MSTEEAMNMLKKKVRHHEWDSVWHLLQTSSIVQTFMKEPDFIRVMIESSDFHAAGNYIRKLGIYRQDLKPLINLLISRLLHAGLFERAVSSAAELVEGFNQKCQDKSYLEVTDQATWTPLAVLQAMVRRKNYDCALRYVSEWGLDEQYPPPTLIKGLFQTKEFTLAVTHIKRRQMMNLFPLDSVVQLMLQGRDWDAAVKLVRETPALQEKWTDLQLVRPIVEARDFIDAVRYMYALKIIVDNRESNSVGGDTVRHLPVNSPERRLCCDLVRSMVAEAEFYKALKYCLKFQLESEFAPETLIQGAINAGQFHIAQKYIIGLALEGKFPDFAAQYVASRRAMACEFRSLVKARQAHFEHVCRQANVQISEVPLMFEYLIL